MYADNSYKFAVVLNERIPLPQLFNALGHMTAGLIATAGREGNLDTLHFLQYEDSAGQVFPAISTYPFIILAARNSNQLRTLRQNALSAGLLVNSFVDTMLGSSAMEQMVKTRTTPEEELTYFGVLVFGPAAVLAPMTHKFSLFKDI